MFFIESVATTTLLSAFVYLFKLGYGQASWADEFLTMCQSLLPAGRRPSSHRQCASWWLRPFPPCTRGHCPCHSGLLRGIPCCLDVQYYKQLLGYAGQWLILRLAARRMFLVERVCDDGWQGGIARGLYNGFLIGGAAVRRKFQAEYFANCTDPKLRDLVEVLVETLFTIIF